MVPYLVRFIDSLTNVYVRYNRKRLKGKNGPEDTELALSALFDVLLTVCKVMAPFTPFFTGEPRHAPHQPPWHRRLQRGADPAPGHPPALKMRAPSCSHGMPLCFRCRILDCATPCLLMSPLPCAAEAMYQNLRRVLPEGEAPESVHFCDIPPAEAAQVCTQHSARGKAHQQNAPHAAFAWLARPCAAACHAAAARFPILTFLVHFLLSHSLRWMLSCVSILHLACCLMPTERRRATSRSRRAWTACSA